MKYYVGTSQTNLQSSKWMDTSYKENDVYTCSKYNTLKTFHATI